MNDETLAAALDMVKARLSRLDAALDTYLKARIQAAYDYLTGQGLHLDLDTNGDLMLVVDTAVYQYSNRDSNQGEPQWLRYRIYQRWNRERGDQA